MPLTPSERLKAVIIADNQGNRISAKYYGGFCSSAQEQAHYEKNLPHAEDTGEVDIFLNNGHVIVYQNVGGGTTIYVVGSETENELILSAALDALTGSLGSLCKGRFDRVTLLDNFELVLLTLDEVVDDGIILEIDPDAVTARVLMKGCEAGANVAIEDMTVGQAVAAARDQLQKEGKKGGIFSGFF